MKFCPNCGAEVSEGDKFCTNCGASLSDVAPKAQHQQQSVSQGQPVKSKESILPKAPIKVGGKKFSPKFLIIAIVVVLAIGGFGFYKYRTSPAHNPNNPLANQTITFKRYDDNFEYLSEKSFNRVTHNIMLKVFSKYHLNPRANKVLDSFNVIDAMENPDEVTEFQKKLKNCTTPAEQKQLMVAGKDFFAMADGIKGKLVIVSPSKDLRNGEKVTLRLNINPEIARKYDIDLTPRTVKVQGLDN